MTISAFWHFIENPPSSNWCWPANFLGTGDNHRHPVINSRFPGIPESTRAEHIVETGENNVASFVRYCRSQGRWEPGGDHDTSVRNPRPIVQKVGIERAQPHRNRAQVCIQNKCFGHRSVRHRGQSRDKKISYHQKHLTIMARFNDKVVFITGGASGMGLGTAKLLASEGAKVAIGDINWDLAQESAKTIGSSVIAIKLDQSDPRSIESAIQTVEEKFGGLDYAVNAAAIQGPLGSLEDVSDKDMATVFAVNLTGIAYCLKYEIGALKRRGGGAIVNIASISGMRPTPFLGVYSASKTGVITLTNIAAVEFGPDNIRVNTISPGYVDTPLLDVRIDRGWAASITPNRRCGVPKDIADVAAFLLSDDARQVNGVNMPVDGGLIAGHAIKPPGF